MSRGKRPAPIPAPRAADGPLCRHCHRVVDWSNIRRSDREVQPNVYERAYFCPYCRSVLEFASWQTGTSRRR